MRALAVTPIHLPPGDIRWQLAPLAARRVGSRTRAVGSRTWTVGWAADVGVAVPGLAGIEEKEPK
jgi:hypothetical protein